jgi:hypothetical protein
MDALGRLAPVARPLLRQVDNALATLGAPPEHPVWGLLRRVGATPADAVGFVADLEPARLRTAAEELRARADGYASAVVPARLSGWEGASAEVYATRAVGLATHLHAGLVDRLRASASYVDAVADWYAGARDQLAHCLADVLGSRQAMAVRSQPAVGGGLTELLRDGVGGDGGTGEALATSVRAAADIGVAILGVAEDAVARGGELHRRWAAELSELTYREPVHTEPLGDGTIRLHQ